MPDLAEKPTAEDFRALGLKPEASIHEVKRAYRDLAKRWHPDRHQQRTSHEKKNAEERFKEITVAYRRISKGLKASGKDASFGYHAQRRQQQRRSQESEEGVRAPTGKSSPEATPQGASQSFWQFIPIRFKRPSSATFNGSILIAGSLMLSALIVFLLQDMDGSHTPTGAAVSKLSPTHPQGSSVRSQPKGVSQGTLPNPEHRDMPVPPNQANGLSSQKVSGGGEEAPHFTLGSTEAEVLRVQGPPSRVHGQVWTYGLSEVHFREGRVWRYNNFDQSLKVRVLPSVTASGNEPEFFTVGSTKDEVLRVQGTPTRIEGNRWYYGFSEVRFRTGMVEDYDNYFGNLKIRILPSEVSTATTPQNHFTIGSSQNEVLAAQGTPTSIQGNFWFYHLSNILFRDGKVQHVVNAAGNLRFVSPTGDMKEARESEQP